MDILEAEGQVTTLYRAHIGSSRKTPRETRPDPHTNVQEREQSVHGQMANGGIDFANRPSGLTFFGIPSPMLPVQNDLHRSQIRLSKLKSEGGRGPHLPFGFSGSAEPAFTGGTHMCCRHLLLALLCSTLPAGARIGFADERSVLLADLQDVDSRVATAAEIAYQGHSIEWQKHSLEELNEIEQRITTAKFLARLGENVDWQEYTLEELTDRNERVSMANQLAKYLYYVDWRKHSPAEMESTERRIKFARFLASYYGQPVDWKDHDISQLQDIRSRIIAANNLSRRGQEVDWRDVALPSDIYEDLAPELAELVQVVSRRSGSSGERALALIERSLMTLQREGIEIDESLLIQGFADIHERIIANKHDVPLPNVLAAYITYRRNDMTHVMAVQNVIKQFPRAPIVFVSRGDTSVQWVIEYREESIAGRVDARYYVARGTVENLGKDELVLPNLGGNGGVGAEILLLVDQTGQKYSPIQNQGTVDPEATLRPGLPSNFTYYFEVPIDSTVAEFIGRELDQVKNQFGDDSEIRIPVSKLLQSQ